MNIAVRELKSNLKVFLIWVIVVLFFDFAGIMKFTGVGSAGADSMQQLIDSFPPIVLAVLGFGDLNPTVFSGFYGLLMFYIGIMVVAYAVHLGLNAVSRESQDGTYEFLFVRPRSRSAILSSKLIAALLALAGFVVVNLLGSAAGYLTLERPAVGEPVDGSGLSSDIPWELFGTWSAWLAMVGLIFLTLGAALAAACPNAAIASRAGNCAVLVCYLAAVAYDALSDHAAAVIFRVLSPMRYWLPSELNEGVFSGSFSALAAVLTVAGVAAAYAAFSRRDLTA